MFPLRGQTITDRPAPAAEFFSLGVTTPMPKSALALRMADIGKRLAAIAAACNDEVGAARIVQLEYKYHALSTPAPLRPR
jgi:hypothetical protein